MFFKRNQSKRDISKVKNVHLYQFAWSPDQSKYMCSVTIEGVDTNNNNYKETIEFIVPIEKINIITAIILND